MKNMNTRFEPDSLNLGTFLEDIKSCLINSNNSNAPPRDPDKLRKYVERKMSESNFSTRLSDAHQNVKANYKLVETIDQKLKDKFLGGKTPNPKYDIKEQEQLKKSSFGRISANLPNNIYNQQSSQIYQAQPKNYSVINNFQYKMEPSVNSARRRDEPIDSIKRNTYQFSNPGDDYSNYMKSSQYQ